jgi:hypothetical protein
LVHDSRYHQICGGARGGETMQLLRHPSTSPSPLTLALSPRGEGRVRTNSDLYRAKRGLL